MINDEKCSNQKAIPKQSTQRQNKQLNNDFIIIIDTINDDKENSIF